MTSVCVTCGTQYPPADQPPEYCPICEDERQYIGLCGQQWTTLDELRTTHKNVIREQGTGVWGIGTEPKFGIGQRALLVQTEAGNILWDCISLIDADTIARINEPGGIKAIAISHPHYYSSMIEWSRAFGNAPIYLHEDDRKWVQRHDSAITFWHGETYSLANGFTLIRIGGHFSGYQVLHWANGEAGQGALLSGDLPQVCPDRRFVSFMYSYPNYIPLSASKIRGIVAKLEPYSFVRIYGAWWDFVVQPDAKAALQRSAERYLRALED